MKVFYGAVLAATLTMGCSRSSQLLPLELGNTWTYDCSAGLVNRVVTVRVTGSAPVGQVAGWKMESEMGVSTLAWQDGRLIASRLGNTEFFPPLPLYAEVGVGGKVKWKGKARTAGSTLPASATLTVSSSEETVEGKKLQLPVGQVSLSIDGTSHEIDTWLRRGRGIHLQEHRIGGQLVSRMRYVSGP